MDCRNEDGVFGLNIAEWGMGVRSQSNESKEEDPERARIKNIQLFVGRVFEGSLRSLGSQMEVKKLLDRN